MKKLLSLLILFSILSFSCKKDISTAFPSEEQTDEPQKPGQANGNSCYISNWDDGNLIIKYGYDSSNRLTSTDISGDIAGLELPTSRTFSYKSDRVVVTEYPGNKSYNFMLSENRVVKFTYAGFEPFEISYSADGYLTKIKQADNMDGSTSYSREFKYENGNLTRMIATGSSTPDNEVFSLTYYEDKKAIEGVDMALNQFVLEQWDVVSPFQLPTALFGKQSANLLKSIKLPYDDGVMNFMYDFDSNGKVIRIIYIYENVIRIADVKYNCKK